MPTTVHRIVCEVCSLESPVTAWRENKGYCPNCQQPGGVDVMRALHLSPSDLEPDEDVPQEYRGFSDLDERYMW
ncbi:MAG: hypothetical protein JXQ73_07370 [Phycisphaerae bacterium]|nr:hypothetical protein [Phycisphaerae bacterium]